MDIFKIFCQIEIILALLKSIIVDFVVDPVNVYVCGDNDEVTRKYNGEPNYFREQSLTQNLSTLHCKNITHVWGSLLRF